MLDPVPILQLSLFVSTGAGGDSYSIGLDNQKPVGKIGAKKQKRLEMKEEKRVLREVGDFTFNLLMLFSKPFQLFFHHHFEENNNNKNKIKKRCKKLDLTK